MSDIDSALSKKMLAVLESYAPVPRSEWEKVYRLHKRINLKRDEYFLREGDVPDRIAMIVSGMFRVFFTSEDGEERTLVFRNAGRLLSGFNSYSVTGESWYSIQAIENSTLSCIMLSDYQKLQEEHGCWRAIYTRYLESIYSEKELRERDFLSLDAETRYENLLSLYPGIETRVRQYHIASFLGISPVSLSRIRKNRKNGLNLNIG